MELLAKRVKQSTGAHESIERHSAQDSSLQQSKRAVGYYGPSRVESPFTRITRRQTQQAVHDLTIADTPREPSRSPMEPIDPGPAWKGELVFPRVGKNKAVVHYSDLSRLNEGEMLNDSLVGFYLRFLEETYGHHQGHSKQVYIFNSLFYDRLIQNPKGGINYDGVTKWTRNEDIFSYDYLMVPICDKSHWYLALICNLPQLKRRMTDDADPEVVEIMETPRRQDPQWKTESGLLRRGILSILQNDDVQSGRASESGSKVASDPFDMDIPTSKTDPSGFKSSPKPKKQLQRRRPIKPGECYIVILDSMGQQKNQSIRFLRQYIIKEAQEKRNLQITNEDLKAFHVRDGIPLQDNAIDCGLFVCGYAEKFMDDPAEFGRKMVENEFDEHVDWPQMSAPHLRVGMLKLLKDEALKQGLLEPKKKVGKRKLERKSSGTQSDMNTAGEPSSTPVRRGDTVALQHASVEALSRNEASAIGTAKHFIPPSEQDLAASRSPDAALPSVMVDLADYEDGKADIKKIKNTLMVSENPTSLIVKGASPPVQDSGASVIPDSQESVERAAPLLQLNEEMDKMELDEGMGLSGNTSTTSLIQDPQNGYRMSASPVEQVQRP
jgi:hypothetical protein